MQRPPRPWFELVFFASTAFSVVPLWLVERPPIQDLPQHLAAVRILLDHDVPALRFADYFEVELWRTQYLAYYLAARTLASAFGVLAANKLLVSAAILTTPYAMRFLLRSLAEDERPALFLVPLAWNAHLILGFLNFIAAIPLCLVGLALAVKLRDGFTTRRAVGLAIVSLVAFYTHVVPFGLLGLGAAMVAVGDDLNASLRRMLPLLPSACAALAWARLSPAGQATTSAVRLREAAESAPEPSFLSAAQNLQQAPSWVTDVLYGPSDDHALVAWLVLAMCCFALGPLVRRRHVGPSARLASAKWRLAMLAPLCAALYFALPASYDWIWPINARFALLTLLFVPLSLPAPTRLPGHLVFAAVIALSWASTYGVAEAFVAFDRDEVGALDEAIAAIPEGSRVAGLIFDRGSAHVKFSPFLHSAAWVQAERGGAAMFTFADFPQSPVRFREDNRPPRVPPRWEWTPERVRPGTQLAWYEYALVRGGPGAIATMPAAWSLVYESPRWRVYRNIGERQER